MRPAASRTHLDRLLELLDVEQLDSYFFRGISEDSGSIRVFGGHVIGQAASAALKTVPEERHLHSMHAYFLRPGKPVQPILYQVDPIRDGGSFTTRRVTAFQSGEPIFSTSLSFHKRQPGPEHEMDMGTAPAQADDLKSHDEMWDELLAQHPDKIPAKSIPSAIDVRPFHLRNPLKKETAPPENWVWMRAKGTLSDDNAIHQRLFAYMSDMQLLGTSLQPHALNMLDPRLQIASLDHGIWFHDSFRVDEWILCYMDSPVARHARGFNRATVWDVNGKLVASTVQEGLVRPSSK